MADKVKGLVHNAWGNEASTSFDNLTVKNPLRYRGAEGYLHLYGPDACRGWSLYLAGARVYHTGVGRWLTEDPLLGNVGDPMSFNRYLYVNANPVDYSDPSGLIPYNRNWRCIHASLRATQLRDAVPVVGLLWDLYDLPNRCQDIGDAFAAGPANAGGIVRQGIGSVISGAGMVYAASAITGEGALAGLGAATLLSGGTVLIGIGGAAIIGGGAYYFFTEVL